MSAQNPRRVALTGATGFVGQHVLSALRHCGKSIKALTRRPQAPLENVEWIMGDLHNTEALRSLVADTDVLIHLAGAIKGRTRARFDQANVQGTENLLAVATQLSTPPSILFVSTQAARQPHISAYAASKATAEEAVQSSKLDWRIIRPPAVYGPGDRETLFFFKAAVAPIAALPVPAGQRATLVHVSDLSQAILHVMEQGQTLSGKIFEISDALTAGYAAAELVREIAELASVKPRIVHLPKPLLYPAAWASLGWGHASATDPMLTPGKLRELQHPDWSGQNLLQHLTGWQPSIPLRQGIAETLAWYRSQNWL